MSAHRAADDRIQVTVHDTGNGISKQDLPRIFDPFFTTKRSGTGLGLCICYEIIKAHGGEIEIESKIGRGTCVTVLLPADNRSASLVQRDAGAKVQPR